MEGDAAPELSIRQASEADAAVLADFAARTFAEAFGALNDPADVALHLSRAYGVAQQTAELRDPARVTLLAEMGGELAGYAMVRRAEVPVCVTGPAPVEVQRFYVDQPWHGRGVAQRLMRAAEEVARGWGGETLWLTVWGLNHRAVAFYEKCGFTDIGEHPFLLGNDLQVDRVMARPLVE